MAAVGGRVEANASPGGAEAAAGGKLQEEKWSKMGMDQSCEEAELDEPVRDECGRRYTHARARGPSGGRADVALAVNVRAVSFRCHRRRTTRGFLTTPTADTAVTGTTAEVLGVALTAIAAAAIWNRSFVRPTL